MRISEFITQKLKSFFNPLSAICNLQSIKYFSLHQQWVLFLIALLILGILYFKFYYHPLPSPSEEFVREIVVEVSGEVKSPGIYIFQNPPTLKEVIEKAGGLKRTAAFDPTLSTEILETGTLLNIIQKSSQEIKVKMERMAANKLLVFSIPLDLNRVSLEDLCLIPGIGESLAQEIIAYRERRRGFRSIEELRNVKGVGEKKWRDFGKFFIVHS
jgi:competence ComEA-like helix-hairpin-helix protein